MSYLNPIDPIDSFDPSTLINPVETSFIANEYDGEHNLPPFDPSDDPFAPIYPVQDPPLHYIYAHQDVAVCLYDLIHALSSLNYLDLYPSLANLEYYAADPDFREIPYEVRHKLLMEFEYMITTLFPLTHDVILSALCPTTHAAIL